MAYSSSHQSIWHPIFVEITKALGAAVGGKLSDYAISQILRVIIDYQDQQLSLLQSISQDVKDIKEGPYYTGLMWLNEAGRVGITRKERMRNIEQAKKSFFTAAGQARRDKFHLALIQYHIGVCALMCDQAQDAEIRYEDAGDWIEQAYNSAIDFLDESFQKLDAISRKVKYVGVPVVIGTFMLTGPLLAILDKISEDHEIPFLDNLGKRPIYMSLPSAKKIIKEMESVYLFLNEIKKFQAETSVVPLNLERRIPLL